MPDTVGLRLAAGRVIVAIPDGQHDAFWNDFVDPLRKRRSGNVEAVPTASTTYFGTTSSIRYTFPPRDFAR